MDLDQIRFLLSDSGQKQLSEIASISLSKKNHLQLASQLRREVEPAQAQAIIETVFLRQQAITKFTQASHMLFTREALEQASSEIIANYRAARFFKAGIRQIIDLGCGIGGDALALASKADVIAVDRNLVRLKLARHNARVYGRADHFYPLLADLQELPPIPGQALFFDPARRDDRGRRLKSVVLYQPPLSLINHWRAQIPHAAVKISPGVDYDELPAEAETEFISLSGALKEAVLWYGDLGQGSIRKATLLPGGSSLSSADYPGDRVPIREPAAYLYEPDHAVIRAHLVQHLARKIKVAQIDAQIAYLTDDKKIESQFARRFKIESWFPFQLKRLRQYLRERHVGHVTIKKRGSPIEPQTLQKQLRLKGDQSRIIFLTHVLGKPAVIVAYDI